MKKILSGRTTEFVLVAIGILVYAWYAYGMNFIQDDAYITYRYVANYLNGDGLVYNVGERIEGFTNFGWTVFLIFWGSLGASYIFISKVAGFLLGGGLIILSWLMARLLFNGREKWFALLPLFLVATNQSLAYWSPAGLETAAFAFMVMLSLYCYLQQSKWLLFALTMAVWIRPEGALVAGIIIGIEWFMIKRLPKNILAVVGIALVLSLPMVLFKVLYYGSIFPNPFYAKTGLNMQQLSNGLEYTWRFFQHYGFYGAGFIIPLLFYRRMNPLIQKVFLFTMTYIAYIVLVGGDVLKVHRFFLPLFGTSAILATATILWPFRRQAPATKNMILVMVSAGLIALTVVLPSQFVRGYNRTEIMFTKRMQILAINLLASDSSSFSVAVPTIGVFGYELIGHEVIDLLGLTDSTIARHSEEPIEGMQTTWKEQKHNSRYLLRRAPDYIAYSTGIKPSAPAERALWLFPQFQDCYRTVGWFYQSDTTISRGIINSVFKRVREITGKLEPTHSLAAVEAYKVALDHYTKREYQQAIKYLNRAVRASKKPYYPYILHTKGFCHLMLGQHDQARAMFSMVLKQDSLVFESHKTLYLYAILDNLPERAAIHQRWLQKLVPWYWPKIQRDAANMLARQRQQSGGK